MVIRTSRTPRRARPRALALALLAAVAAGALSAPAAFAGQADDWFIRGDANRDGALNIADAVAALDYLFGGAGAILLCDDAADSNDDGALNIADPVALLAYLFTAPIPLPSPFGGAGGDPTADLLGCAPIDCLTPVEVEASLGIATGTFVIPGAIPPQTIVQSGVTVDIGAADGALTISTVDYDPVLDTIVATGTAGAVDVPTTITWTIFTFNCLVDFSVPWTMSGAFVTTPWNAESSRIVSVEAGSVVVTTGTPTTAITGCALGAISGLVGGLLASSAQDAIDATLPTLIADLTAQIDAALAAAPVIVCD